MPDVEIGRHESTKIHEAPPNGTPNGLVIRTAERQRFINIPVALDGYDEVKDQLGHWQQIEPLSTKKYLGLQTLIWLLVPAAYLVMFISRNAWLVLTVGILLIALMGFAVVELRRSMNVDSRVKNMKIMVFGFIVLIVIIVVRVYVLVAHVERQ
jgi:hypothetical protein